MGSKGSNTVTTNQSQTYSPNQPILGAGQQAVSGAQSAAQLPFQMPVAPVAGFTPFQQQGFNQIQGLQGYSQPYFNLAGGYLAGSAAPVTGADVANYYNPMAANVTAQMQNIFGQQNVQNTGDLVRSAGGVGADRIAVGQANLANQQGLAAGQTYAGLYQAALQAAQQQKQMMAGAGYGLGQMGPAALAAQLNETNQLLGAGGMQQQLAQQQANAQYQNQLARIAFPYQQPQYLAGITAGLAPAMGGTTTGQATTTYPAPSPLAQALGIGTAGLGLFGGMGFGNVGAGFGGATNFANNTFTGAQPGMPNYATAANPFNPFTGQYGFEEGGAVKSDYGDLADQMHRQEYANVIMGAAKGNPLAAEVGQDLGYDDGGGIEDARVIPVGEVVPLDPFSGSNESLENAFARLDNRKTLGASGLRAANPLSVDRAKEHGVLKIFPSPKNLDDGGVADQQQPMQLNLSPTSVTGLDAPGANPKMSFGSVIPKTQLPQGQGGKSGAWGQYMFMQPPTKQGQQQHSPMGGINPMQLGQMMGGMGGGDMANLGADLGLSGGAADAVDVAAEIAPEVLAADGGAIDDYPTIGPGAPTARPQRVPLPRPYPGERGQILGQEQSPVSMRYGVGDQGQGETFPGSGGIRWTRRIAAGGAVTPMHVGEGFQEGGDINPFTAAPAVNEPTPEPRPFWDTASKVYHYVTDRPPPGGPTTVPPEAQMTPSDVGRGAPMGAGDFERPDTGRAGPLVRDPFTEGASAAPYVGDRDTVPANIKPPEMLPQPPQLDSSRPVPYAGLSTVGDASAVAQDQAPPIGNVPLPQPRPPMGATGPVTGGAPAVRQGAGHVPMGAGMQPGVRTEDYGAPYPDALNRDWGQNLTRSPWMALVKAGAAMATSPGPIGSVIGRGIQAGAGELEQERAALRTEEQINLKAQALHDAAQRHLDAYTKMTPAQRDASARGWEHINLMRDRFGQVSASAFNSMLKQVTSEPEWIGKSSKEQYAEAQRRADEYIQHYRDQMLFGSGQPGQTTPLGQAGPGMSRDTAIADPGEGKRQKGMWYLNPNTGKPDQWQ